MKICVFGAASNLIDEKYVKDSEELCYKLAKNGHELVFGAGARITGVIPHFFKTDTVEPIYDKCDELIFTDTMRERKKIMEDTADAFVVLPGGIGTLEELFEIITLKQLAQHKKPIAFYNIYGYYDKLMGFLDHCESEKFIREGCHNLYLASDDDEKIIEYIEDDTPFALGLKDLK